MRTSAGIILQARYGSTRLRGKVLEPMGGRTILEHCLRRLVQAGVARVVLATTTQPDDDALEAVAMRIGVPVHRGDRDDVLGRFSEAASRFGLDPVLRATADNPAVDLQAPRRIIATLGASGADYVREQGLPMGAAVEGMTAEALHRAARLAADAYDREHVTTFILKRRDLFSVKEIDAPAPLRRPSLRLTVDTREDLVWVRELFVRAGSDDPSLATLIAVSGGNAGEAEPQTRKRVRFDASGFGSTSPNPVCDRPRSARAVDASTEEDSTRDQTFEAVRTSRTPVYGTEVA